MTPKAEEEKRCTNKPIYRYTWPGKPEAFVCLKHSWDLINIASAMDIYLELNTLPADKQETEHCSQIIKEEHEMSLTRRAAGQRPRRKARGK